MGEYRVTLADVARLAGLSKATASMVLNGRQGTRLSAEAHERVLAAAEELGYRPNPAARSLRTKRTATIGFISDIVATAPYAGNMIRGALEAAREHDHVLLIAETHGDKEIERLEVEAILDRHVDGVIFAAMAARRLQVPPKLLTPATVLLNATSTNALTSVLPDDEGAGHAVAMTLVEHGHRDRIALIGRNLVKERNPGVSVAAGLRLRGIRRALAAHGVRLHGEAACDDWQPEHGYEAMRWLLRTSTRYSAVICLNDRLAFGVYQALAEAGLSVPNDVSVVSFDDDVIASWLRPGLTSAALPHVEMGRVATELLLSGNLMGQTVRVSMPLRHRQSVAAPGPYGSG
ncbi:MAG TPA: LacI family DNA-binding transcriptional regulator [Rugosimonospora sp.]|nr:LacI family DNA-binding transcriptional regulator [Rugosimonospora sp.]